MQPSELHRFVSEQLQAHPTTPEQLSIEQVDSAEGLNLLDLHERMFATMTKLEAAGHTQVQTVQIPHKPDITYRQVAQIDIPAHDLVGSIPTHTLDSLKINFVLSSLHIEEYEPQEFLAPYTFTSFDVLTRITDNLLPLVYAQRLEQLNPRVPATDYRTFEVKATEIKEFNKPQHAIDAIAGSLSIVENYLS